MKAFLTALSTGREWIKKRLAKIIRTADVVGVIGNSEIKKI